MERMLRISEKKQNKGCCCDVKMFLKKLLIIFNVYYWFSGPACLGLGIWFLLIIRQLEPSLDPAEFSLSSYAMIGAGGAIIVYGFIGCMAIFNEHRCLLGFYFVLMVTSFAAQLTSCLKLFLLYDTIESHVNYNLNISVRYKYLHEPDITAKLDTLQQEFSCCGVRNYTDWESSYYSVRGNGVVGGQGNMTFPSSCYMGEISPPSVNLTYTNDTSIVMFTKGCASPVSSMVKKFCEIFGWTTFAMSGMQLIGGTLVYCLRTAIND